MRAEAFFRLDFLLLFYQEKSRIPGSFKLATALEFDTFLDECFVETPIYSSLVSFNSTDLDFTKRIIIGRTGSGKTALIKFFIGQAMAETDGKANPKIVQKILEKILS